MEDTLRDSKVSAKDILASLNPCFNGRYSQSSVAGLILKQACVLILVLMEDTLRAYEVLQTISFKSLNPCFNGRCSQSMLETIIISLLVGS